MTSGISSRLSSPIQPAHTRKPNPEEPWRYVCPDCNGQVNTDRANTRYRCCRCMEWFDRGELVDLKGAA